MIKVLLIQNYITDYNLPLYEIISNDPNIDLTILHFGKFKPNTKINQIILPIKKILNIYFTNSNLFKICRKFDVVISLGDLHYPQLALLSIKRLRNFKFIYWTIGVSASYKNRFDKSKRWDFVRNYFYRKADALLFYSEYPVSKYIKFGFNYEKLFVAPNTIDVITTKFIIRNKDYILFIGTLYKEKGIFSLLDAYLNAKRNIDCYPYNLLIIGEGPEFNNIQNWVTDNKLQNNITLKGSIFNENTLKNYFLKSIICVSPNQAGLSVLKSMGYGVPFITNSHSITGGEIFNIQNKINGILYDNENDLYKILCEIKIDPEKFIQMGKLAHQFYFENRTLKDMSDGFIRAINYVSKKNIYFANNN